MAWILTKRVLGLAAPALVAGALVAGVHIAGAQAPTPTPTPQPQATATPAARAGRAAELRQYLNNVLARAARKLGIDQARLVGALKDSAKEELDELVKAGRITQQQADRAKQRIDQSEFGFLRAGPPLPPPASALGRGHVINTVASLTNQSPQEVMQQLRSGKSLKEIAEAKGISESTLIDKLLEPLKSRLQQAVSSGRITQQRADEMLARARRTTQRMVEAQPGARRNPSR
jgi:uncharacterized protein YidB (DUF937 family)